MAVRALLSAGSNAQGQLATGDTEDAHAFVSCSFLGAGSAALPENTSRVRQVACGANHTIVLLERVQGPSGALTHELWGCGDGKKGQLGVAYDGSDTTVFRPLDLNLPGLRLEGYVIRTVVASWETTYVVLSRPEHRDVVLSMGADDFGDLGINGKGKAVHSTVHVVNFDNVIPTNHEEKKYTLVISHISAGPHHVVAHLCATYADGTELLRVVGWGTSRHGQLGAYKDAASGKPVPYLASPHLISLPIDPGESITSSALGTHHTVLVRGSGGLLSLGSSRKSQLDGIEALQNISMVGCTWNGTYAVSQQGDAWSIFSAGNHNKGQLGRPLHVKHNNPHGHHPLAVQFPFSSKTHDFVKMVCGSEHVLCLFRRKDMIVTSSPATEVWGWGWNEHGNLGLGSTEDKDAPVKIWPPSQEEHRTVLDIWAGYGTTWVLV
ncbi:hypothetical protein EIP86_004473 [Pleurotus ostreatoroseus]|nr:hypothetical protein EIP86_004473 [Pleurotus ostreatoroseus]